MATAKKPAPKKPVAKQTVKKTTTSKASTKTALKKAVAKKPVAAKTTKKSGGKKKHIVRRILEFKIAGSISRKTLLIGISALVVLAGGFGAYAVYQNMSASAGGAPYDLGIVRNNCGRRVVFNINGGGFGGSQLNSGQTSRIWAYQASAYTFRTYDASSRQLLSQRNIARSNYNLTCPGAPANAR